MVRAIRPALRAANDQWPLLALFLISVVAIAVFYVAALGYGRRTNLAMAEYWRWWVVHLWVEGFFEVFATVVIAFLFSRLKLVTMRTAGEASILSATICLSGGIIGTLHHLYFSGTPTVVLALGAVFSALEVVPLLCRASHTCSLTSRPTRSPFSQQHSCCRSWPMPALQRILLFPCPRSIGRSIKRCGWDECRSSTRVLFATRLDGQQLFKLLTRQRYR